MAMSRTHVILDGLADPRIGGQLSAAWLHAGFANTVDPAGQCASLWRADSDSTQCPALSEADMDRAAAVARTFGLEPRDRVGNTFVADNQLPELRKRLAFEYKSRFATALVFGLPAIALHRFGPLLAGGGPGHYAWLIELLLAGWTCIAAGWPILYQGALCARYLRVHGDLLTTVVVVFAYVPSAIGVLSMMWSGEPWLIGDQGPAFDAAVWVIIVATLQRWLAHCNADRLAGRAAMMLTGVGRFIVAWLIFVVIVMFVIDSHAGLMVAMLLPSMISHGAISRWSPGWSSVFPVVTFAIVLVAGPGALNVPLDQVRFEIAVGFALMTTCAMVAGWRRFPGMAQ